jgi:hypothetical protein
MALCWHRWTPWERVIFREQYEGLPCIGVVPVKKAMRRRECERCGRQDVRRDLLSRRLLWLMVTIERAAHGCVDRQKGHP